jgi:hypothetical protein
MKTFTLTVLAAMAAMPLRAGTGTTAGDFLKVSPDARSAGLGNTGVADAASGFAAFQNPSLLSQSQSRYKAAGGQMQWLMGSTAGHYEGSAAFRTAAGTAWALGATYTRWDVPSFQATDALGNTTGKVSYAAQAAGLAASRSLTETIHVGGAVKQISQTFSGAAAGAGTSGMAWDAGTSFRAKSGNWGAGAALLNMGKAGDEKLPSTIRAGMEGRFADGRLQWSLEGSKSEGGKMNVSSGFGFNPLPSLSLRGGYDARVGGAQYAGLTSGFGLAFGNVRMDYSFSPFGETGAAQRISLSWSTGGQKAVKRVGPTPNRRRADSNTVYGSWMANSAIRRIK